MTHACWREVRFGLAKRGVGSTLEAATDAFFATFKVLPWTRSTAAVYGKLRASRERRGRRLQPLDMMIAARSHERGLTLVTNDRALLSTPGLTSEDWLAA